MSTVNPSATVTIPINDTVSNAIDLGEFAVVGIQTPSALTGTALTFQASSDNSTFCAVTKVDGTAYSVVVAASKYIAVPPADLCGIRYLKAISGSGEAAARTIILLLRAV